MLLPNIFTTFAAVLTNNPFGPLQQAISNLACRRIYSPEQITDSSGNQPAFETESVKITKISVSIGQIVAKRFPMLYWFKTIYLFGSGKIA